MEDKKFTVTLKVECYHVYHIISDIKQQAVANAIRLFLNNDKGSSTIGYPREYDVSNPIRVPTDIEKGKIREFHTPFDPPADTENGSQ